MIQINRIAAQFTFVVACVVIPNVIQAQAKLAARPLGEITAVGSETMGVRVAVRPMSNGKVLVNDIARQRLLLFDETLKTAKVVMDSGSNAGSSSFGGASAQLIPFTADSSLYVDVSSRSLLVLDPMGKFVHVMALPRPTDAMFLSVGAVLGSPAIDSKGRLVYRGVIVNLPKAQEPGAPFTFNLPEQPDSAPIVRADFDSRKVDTLTTIKAQKPGTMSMAPDKEGNIVMKQTINPLDAGDEWAMITDGSIAIVRAHDYHIDWLDTDGTKRSSPKMPFDWKRLTDEQKQYKVDSIRPEIEKQLETQKASLPMMPTPAGPRRLQVKFDFVPLNKISDYEPPIAPGSVRADLDNHVWIAPRTAINGGSGGLIYDVVDNKGEVIDRVQFPKGRALAGFGPNGDVYMINTDGKFATLERAKLR